MIILFIIGAARASLCICMLQLTIPSLLQLIVAVIEDGGRLYLKRFAPLIILLLLLLPMVLLLELFERNWRTLVRRGANGAD